MKNSFLVCGIGELLWDFLPEGRQAGGAPFNFAWHALQAGCESYVVSAVGKDHLGTEILAKLTDMQVHTKYVQCNNYPTGTVSIQLDNDGHPVYSIHEEVAWDYLDWEETLGQLSGKLDAICFGSLAQRNVHTARTIQRIISGLRPDCLKVFDVNLRQHYYDEKGILQLLSQTNILKVNDSELPVIAGYHGFDGDSISQLEQLLQRYGFRCIAYTMGGAGSILISRDVYSLLEAPLVRVADTVGAGDSFTAMLVAGMLKGMPIRKVHQMATEVAAYVCTQNGATPHWPEALLTQMNEKQ